MNTICAPSASHPNDDRRYTAMRKRFRTVWISDVHLGSNTVRGADLSHFLRHISCDRLYLVGDIVDMWRLRQRWRWPACHNDVVRRLLKLASKGVEVIWIPGNHDDAIRPYDGLSIGGIRVELMSAHETADGRRLLVTHGDHHDLVVCSSKALATLGSVGYDLLLGLNRIWNGIRRRVGLPYHSLSQAIKDRVKSACAVISRFEDALEAEARRGGFHGVVCGHIHKAECRAKEGFIYLNCGDWVESCTALVEHADGSLEILDGLAFNERIRAEKAASRAEEPAEETEAWPEPHLGLRSGELARRWNELFAA
jgi:UDP-2,3-diacylglucosamine pyrophosphatase LpxH